MPAGDLDTILLLYGPNGQTITFNGDIAYSTATVYFGDSDENPNRTRDDGSAMVTTDWNAFDRQQVMNALQNYTRILGVN